MSEEELDRSQERRLGPHETQDEDLEREIEAALGDQSLEDIADQEQQGGSQSQVRTGTVVGVHGDDVFVDLGGKNQGILPAGQFDEEPLPAEGDRVEVTVQGYDERDGLLVLSRKGAIHAAAWENVRTGDVVEGRVTGHNNGGLELSVDGIRAFMPVSQVEIGSVEDLAPYHNRRLQCEVLEVKRQEESLIVSHRAVLRKQAEQQKQQTLETLAEGQTVSGTVKTVMPYGAFVDLGGIDGLLHVSDMSYGHVDKPEDLVHKGQEITVMVLGIDRQSERISLGLKQILADPWEGVESKYPIDEVVTGRVTKLADFGAFVELEPGVEGLIPISEMTYERRIKHPGEIVSEGETVKVRVINLDTRRNRITLSIKRMGADPWTGASVRWPEGRVVEGTVKRIADYGAFVELASGVQGLVHISELSGGYVRSVRDVVEEGQRVRVKVLNVDEDSRRIALSIKQAGSAEAEAAAQGLPIEKPAPKRNKRLKGGLD